MVPSKLDYSMSNSPMDGLTPSLNSAINIIEQGFIQRQVFRDFWNPS